MEGSAGHGGELTLEQSGRSFITYMLNLDFVTLWRAKNGLRRFVKAERYEKFNIYIMKPVGSNRFPPLPENEWVVITNLSGTAEVKAFVSCMTETKAFLLGLA